MGEAKAEVACLLWLARDVREHCRLAPVARDLLRAAMNHMHLSAHAFHRVLKLSCTIADLVGDEAITAARVAGAIQHRPLRLGYTGCPRCLANMIQC
ncbi:MAG: hypothetical protein Q7R39_20220 [Dehalococcoidia bacterium]|nr:hypothetical protein [Dehalococcoidia bacterium]